MIASRISKQWGLCGKVKGFAWSGGGRGPLTAPKLESFKERRLQKISGRNM